MKKRILSILLTLCMVLCLVPTSIFAEVETFAAADGLVFDTDYNTKAQELDDNYGYTGYDLGAIRVGDDNNKGMRFRFWSPTASKVSVNIFTTGSDAEIGSTNVGTFMLEKLKNDGKWTGVWQITLAGNWHDLYYTYSVTDSRTGVTK